VSEATGYLLDTNLISETHKIRAEAGVWLFSPPLRCAALV